MALDPTAREANVRDSWKKYLVDNLWTTESIPLLFDKFSATPNVRNKDTVRWVSVDFRDLERDTLSEGTLDIYLATRKDEEWFRLAQLSDTVMGYLTDLTTTDGYKRIPFYRSKASGSWDLLGSMIVTRILESDQMEVETDVKFKIFTVFYRFASKV